MTSCSTFPANALSNEFVTLLFPLTEATPDGCMYMCAVCYVSARLAPTNPVVLTTPTAPNSLRCRPCPVRLLSSPHHPTLPRSLSSRAANLTVGLTCHIEPTLRLLAALGPVGLVTVASLRASLAAWDPSGVSLAKLHHLNPNRKVLVFTSFFAKFKGWIHNLWNGLLLLRWFLAFLLSPPSLHLMSPYFLFLSDLNAV